MILQNYGILFCKLSTWGVMDCDVLLFLLQFHTSGSLFVKAFVSSRMSTSGWLATVRMSPYGLINGAWASWQWCSSFSGWSYSRDWEFSVLRAPIPQHIKDVISAYPISHFCSGVDNLIWDPAPNGEFSSKYAYHWLFHNTSFTLSILQLWKLGAPEKMKYFM